MRFELFKAVLRKLEAINIKSSYTHSVSSGKINDSTENVTQPMSNSTKHNYANQCCC